MAKRNETKPQLFLDLQTSALRIDLTGSWDPVKVADKMRLISMEEATTLGLISSTETDGVPVRRFNRAAPGKIIDTEQLDDSTGDDIADEAKVTLPDIVANNAPPLST